MLLSWALISVVGNAKFHELIKASETIAKRGIFDTFLVRYHKVVQRFQTHDRIN